MQFFQGPRRYFVCFFYVAMKAPLLKIINWYDGKHKANELLPITQEQRQQPETIVNCLFI
jgi:hypothetical protein